MKVIAFAALFVIAAVGAASIQKRSFLDTIDEYASDILDKILKAKSFDEAVDSVVGSIDTMTTEMECSFNCMALIVKIPGISEAIAPLICPAVCKASLAKITDAAEKLADKI